MRQALMRLICWWRGHDNIVRRRDATGAVVGIDIYIGPCPRCGETVTSGTIRL